MRELEYPNDQDIVIAGGVYQNYIVEQTILPAITSTVLQMLILRMFSHEFKIFKFLST